MKRKTPSKKTRKPPASENAFGQALRLLTGRDHTERGLAAKLSRKGFPAAEIEDALQRCRECGYLDDERYALVQARSLLAEGRAVGSRLAAELQRRGLEVELATGAAQKAAEEFPQETILERLFNRRFGGFDFENADSRRRRRMVDYFLRRGFALGTVLQFMREKGCQTET